MDKTEIREASGQDPAVCLREAVTQCDPCHTLVADDGELLAMHGVTPFAPGVGVVWLLGTDGCFAGIRSRKFLKLTKLWLDEQHKRYPVMFNYIRYDNITSIRWLSWSGCTFPGDTVEHSGVPYFLFERHCRV